MSLKIYNEENKKWEKASSLLSSSIKVVDAENYYESENVEGCLRELGEDVDKMNKDIRYIYENGTIGGGSGGGGGGSSVPTIKIDGDLDGQGVNQRVVKSDEIITIYYFFNSPNPGNGVVELSYGNTVIKETIKQGRNKWIVGPFVRGTHNLSIVVEDRQGFMSDPARIRVISGALEITSTFSDAEDFNLSDEISIPYRVYTEIPEQITAELILDGKKNEVLINKGDNRWDIGELSTLGVHTASIRTYCDSAESNILNYTLVVSDSESLFVSTKFDDRTIPQGKRVQIDYRISMKGQYQFKSNLYLDGELMDTVRNPSGVSYWDLGTDLPMGIHTAKITSMTLDEVHKDTLEIEFEVVESGLIEITEPTDGMIAKFDSNGKINDGEKKSIWEDRSGNGVVCRLHNFNYSEDGNGWVTDPDLDQKVLKFSGKTYAEIDLAPFANGVETGFTFDTFFKVANTGNMDAKVVYCKNPATPFQGFSLDTEKALLQSKQTVKSNFQEDKWTRVTFVIDRVGRTIRTYTNAVISNISLIAPREPDVSQDEFRFDGKVFLGAGYDRYGNAIDNSTCSIKTIRMYNRALTNAEILDLHMSDIKNADELNEIYQLNYGAVSIPTMTITGVGIESLEPDGDPVTAKVLYEDPSNASKTFTKDLCQLAIQGTSSKYYPVKNYTLWLRENDGQPSREYTPVDGWMPEDRWTLKTNYMDSSHANNVGLCKFAHELFKENPYPQQEINPNTRSCPDGQAIRVFINGKDSGVYTWNIDRYAHNNYGLVTYNPDGTISRHNTAVSYEVAVNSTNGAGAFNDDSWDSIKREFKHRYNHRGEDVTLKEGSDTVLMDGKHSELIELVSWVKNSTDDEFFSDLAKHFSIPHLIDYYLMAYGFGMIDNLGKNMVITTFGRNEQGHMIWYPSFYDCDSVLGLANNGEIKYDAGVDMDSGSFNTSQSSLWVKLKRRFGQQIKDRYFALRRERNIDGEMHPPVFSAENAMKYLDDEVMAKIGQRYYNDDADRKYVNDEGATWLIACNGDRKEFTRRWLEERFTYLDSVYEVGEFNSKTMVLRTEVLGDITIRLKTYSPMWVRINYTSSSSKKVYVNKDKFYDFSVNMTNGTENDFTIYGASNLMYLNNMEVLNVSHISVAGAEKLIEINCSGSKNIKGLELGSNKYLQRVLCNDCTNLGIDEKTSTLNLSGCYNLKELNCKNTKVRTITLPEKGGVLETLNCENTNLTTFTMQGQEYLEVLSLASCKNLGSLVVRKCDGLKEIIMPNTILNACTIEGCENVTNIDISGTKYLETLELQGCPNLLKLNLAGVLSRTLTDLDLTASLKLQELNISSTPYLQNITFGQYRNENGQLVNFNALKKLNCTSSNIKSLRYGKYSAPPNYMDLAGLNLDYITFEGCANISHIRNINLTGTSGMAPFKNCSNLESITGRIKLTGSINMAFYNCRKLKGISSNLTLDLSTVTSSSEAFSSCTEFTWNDVKFILSNVSSSYTGGWRTFSNCSKLTGPIPEDLFSKATGVTSLNEYFIGCSGITGELPQNLLLPCTRLSDIGEAFRSTKISGAIPVDFLKGPSNSLTRMDHTFYGTSLDTVPTSNLLKWNANISTCAGAFAECKSMVGKIPGDLFSGRAQLTDLSSMFSGCSGIYGEIPRNLFRNAASGGSSKIKFINHMLHGTDMYGDIPHYISSSDKGLFDDMPLLEDVRYFFPRGIGGDIPVNIFRYNSRIIRVSGLFEDCRSITGEIPTEMFKYTPNLQLADRLFKGTAINSIIPPGFFDNCVHLTDVESMFEGCTGLRGQIPKRISEWFQRPSDYDPDVMEDYEVVYEYGLFDKCKSLVSAKSLFSGCRNLRTSIPETLFIAGSELKDVSYLFHRCFEIYGQVPEKLFANCRNLIDISYAFSDCCKLGKTPLEITPEDPYALPPKLLETCRSLKYTRGMFSMWGGDKPQGPTLRGSLHKDMFRTNTLLEDANTMFAGNSLITGELHGDMFVRNFEIKNCENMFYGTQFTSVGANLLRGCEKIDNIKSFLRGNNKVTGPAPKLWETPAKQVMLCFAGCTFSDQASIPPTYK